MHKSAALFLLLALGLAACTAPAAVTAAPATSSSAPAAAATAAAPPTVAASPEPSLTPTPELLDLEIVEWFEHAIPNLADPSITDTDVEILVRNPNDVPVYVNTAEVRFLNAAGEVVYTNSSAYLSLWPGSWMLPGESTGVQICACFQSSGLETREWESIVLIAPLEPATDLVYTMDVEVTLGEAYSLLGGGTGIPITMTNTGDQPLKSIPMRVIARDASGRYIGMAGGGNSVASWFEEILIHPGEGLEGTIESEIIYFDGPLTYEVFAIGIPGEEAGAPLAEWKGIPIMPGALSGKEVEDGYEFTTQATTDEITQYYEVAFAELGYSLTTNQFGLTATQLTFEKGPAQAILGILPWDGLNRVMIITFTLP
jgi:hypothetical protein